MIPIGSSRGPGVNRLQDRWNRWLDLYEPIEFYWADPVIWRHIQWFQQPLQYPKDFSGYLEILRDTKHPLRAALKERVDYAGGSTLLQVSVWDRDRVGLIRTVVGLDMGINNSFTLKEWSLYERTIGYQLSRLKAWRLNRG